VITRNSLHAILVLLAGLCAGYLLSRGATTLQERWLTEIPESYSKLEIPDASLANLSVLYAHHKDQLREVLEQGSALVRETALQTRGPEQQKELAILRVKDYYNQFYLNYFNWLDTGDGRSAVQYKLALGQLRATLDYTMENQGEDPLIAPVKHENIEYFTRIVEQSGRSIRWSRVMVVVMLFLLLMGIPRLIRGIGYRRFAACLYFDAIFRPHHISDLNGWYSTRRMAAAFLGLYLFSWVVFASFVSWRIPLIAGTLGLLPVALYTLFSRSSGNTGNHGAQLLSFMAPKMLLLIPVLGIVAQRGPGFFWFRLWEPDAYRMIFLALMGMLIFHRFRIYVILIRKWTHRSRLASLALLVLAISIQLLVAGILILSFGPEEILSTLNRELLLLPDTLILPPFFLSY